jgi:hypothetical protein
MQWEGAVMAKLKAKIGFGEARRFDQRNTMYSRPRDPEKCLNFWVRTLPLWTFLQTRETRAGIRNKKAWPLSVG